MSPVDNYSAVLLQFLVVAGFAATMLALSVAVGRSGKRSRIKDSAYECGMIPIGEGSPRLSVKFYVVAMLFILFDIEVVFLYPWAVVFRDMLKDGATANMAFLGMVSFLGVLLVGYAYILKKGALDWKS